MKIITQNKKALHDYTILEHVEAGIVLTGDEVKSVRAGHVNLVGSFAHIRDGQLYLVNCHISSYSHAYQKEADVTRTRKLLVHKRELLRFIGDIARKDLLIIPLKIYINARGLIKVDLGLAKHKKAFDRKEEIRERDLKRETRRELKDSYRY